MERQRKVFRGEKVTVMLMYDSCLNNWLVQTKCNTEVENYREQPVPEGLSWYSDTFWRTLRTGCPSPQTRNTETSSSRAHLFRKCCNLWRNANCRLLRHSDAASPEGMAERPLARFCPWVMPHLWCGNLLGFPRVCAGEQHDFRC